MHVSFVQMVGILGPVLQLLIIAALVQKKLRAKFPIFFSFLVFSLLSNFSQIILQPFISPYQYFALYWVCGAISMILGLGIIYEVFINVLKGYSELLDFAKLMFRWAAVFLLMASVLTAVAANGTAPTRICAAIGLFENIVGLMQCGLLLLVLLFQSRLGLSWRTPAISIALGVGCYAVLDLGGSVLSQHAREWGSTIDAVLISLNLLLLTSWLIVIYVSEPSRKVIEEAPARLILQRWNEVLLSTPLVARRSDELAFAPVDSFIPGVEKTVERVLSRKMAAS